MNAKLLAVLVVALLGAAAFLFLQSGTDHGPAPIAGQPADQRPAPAAPAEAAQANVTPASVAADAPGASERTEAPAAVGKGSDTIAVRGRIVDGQGAPRAGVELSVRSWTPPEGLDLVNLPPPPALRGRDADKKPTWTTRGDGTFEVPLARGEVGALELRTRGLVFARNEPTIDGKKGDQDLGDVTALAAASVSGVVKDQRGQPVADVNVAATVGALGFGNSYNATTQADGTFKLGGMRPGRWALRTASGKFLPAVEEIDVAPEEQRTGVVLVVKPGKAIAGQVLDDRGVGVANMKVGSKRKEARAGVDIERFSSDEATTTDANGYFTLSGLAEETASVRAFGPGHTPASAADVPVGTGDLVLRVERLGIVEGVLVGADGAPIADSRVSAQGGTVHPIADGIEVDALDLDGPNGQGRGAVTAADGSFRLESVKPGDATIVARGKKHRPVRQGGIQVLPAQATKGVRLVADLGATARIVVRDEAGKPVAGAKVSAGRAQAPAAEGGQFFARGVRVEDHGDGPVMLAGGDALGTATTGEDGVATIAGLPAGDLTFAATHQDFAPASPVRLAVPKAGTVEGAATMRKPGAVEIVVFGTDGAPLPGVAVAVKAEPGGAPTRATSGEGGVVRLASLAPGQYTAALTRAETAMRLGDDMVFGGDGGGMIASSAQQFAVVAGETVRVELRRPVLARVHGVVSGSDGPIAGCVVALQRDDDSGIPGIGGRSATTGDDGSFSFDDVEPGTCTLEYGKRNQVVKAHQELAVPKNTPEVRQDLVLRTGTLRVQVVAAGSGDPVEKAEVEIARAEAPVASGAPRQAPRRVMMVSMVMSNDSGNADNADMTTMTVGMQRTHTDEAGIAVIDDVPIGDYTVRIKHRKHAPVELRNKSVVEKQVTDLGRVELASAGLIRGKVTGADGKPVRMAFVASRPIDDPQWSEPVMAQGGGYRVQGLAAGKYKVRAQAIGPREQYGPEVEVEVKSGETTNVDLQLPPQ